MQKRTIQSITTLAIPLAMLSACGEIGEAGPEANEAASEHITLTTVEIVGQNTTPTLLQPIEVAITADLSPEAYETNVNVGLRTIDGHSGCVLGAMAIDPPADEDAPSELSTWTADAEFIVNSDCAPLAGRDDVELFVGFDPWHELDGESYYQALEQNPQFDLFTIVSASAVPVAGCASCETTYEVHDIVGLDAELRELNLSSVVAVLPVAGEDGVEPVETTTHSDFTLTMGSRVTGLDKADSLDPGLVHAVHRIRPLGSNDEGLPLVELIDGRQFEAGEIAVPGPSIVATGASLHIEDATRETIVDGAWSNIDEFELVTCLETAFEQATFVGEDGPRANDCGAIPVVIVRAPVGPDGLPLANTDPGAANARNAEVYGDSWGANAGYGFGYSGLSFETWLDVNSSDGPSSTYGGITVYNAGSWYEAGVNATATVFDSPVTLVDIYGTFIGYEFGGGGVAMHAQLFNDEFIPEFELQIADGDPLTLEEIFDAAGVDADPSLTISYPVVGKSFDDGCDDVGASVSIDASVGIDTEETSIMAMSTTQGVEVSGTIAPFFDVSVVASASTGNFLGISAGISASLTLLNITVPFTVAVEVIDYDPLDAMRLQFNEYAGAMFTTLSGTIDFVFKYKDFWGNTVTHDHNIAQWSGFSAYEEFFDLSQHLSIGSDIDTSWCTASNQQVFGGDFDGDGNPDYLCHRTTDGYNWVDFGPSYTGTEWHKGYGLCDNDEQLVIGDYNGDGRDDLYCAGDGIKEIDYANNSGNFYSVNWSTSGNWCIADDQVLRSGDYDLDGLDDLFCYRPSDGQKWIDYASDGFNGTDWTGTSLPDILPSFVSAGSVSLEENWVTVNLPQSFTNPVVIVGPASHEGSDPALVRVQNVTSDSFQIRIQEWDYLDDNHATEEVAWMVIEAGVNVASDGTVWEAGTFLADGSLDTKTSQSFSHSFASTPKLFASSQTYDGGSAVAVRVDNLGASSFQVLVQEQEALTNGHADETIGYLALSAQPDDTGSHNFDLGSASVGEGWTTINGIQLQMEEEQSNDAEVDHSNETVHYFAITPKFGGAQLNFAQDVTFNGTDPAALRWQ